MRALLGLAPSPFLGGVIKQHLDACQSEFPDLVSQIEKSLYIDDLISDGPTVQAACELKAGATHVFGQASFKLHKWHSNVLEVESQWRYYICKRTVRYTSRRRGVHSRAPMEQETRHYRGQVPN